jgi:hypothetical protein
MDDALFDRLELSLPAPWIDHNDRDFAGDVLLILGSAIDQFNDALVACGFFRPIAADGVERGTLGVVCQRNRLEGRLHSLYARAYVYGLDSPRAFVQALSMRPGIPPTAAAACATFLQRFGHIRDIRNSLQHVEERSQGKGSNGKILPGGLLLLGGFIGRRFGVTTGDGQLKEVEISEQFLEAVRSALLEIIWSFEWIHVGNVRVRRPEGARA